MGKHISIKKWSGDTGLIISFYESCGYTYTPQKDEVILVAMTSRTIVGAVRLCREHEQFVLRGMQVVESLRGQGVGRQLLSEFAHLIGKRECYCLPYTHLEEFYSCIGFQTIRKDEAPGFLRERLETYRAKRNGKSYILMRRPPKE